MKIKLNPLDVLFSKLVRLRADGVCEYCGRARNLQCSHFIGRRKQVTRYDLDNAAGLCFECHMYLGEHPYEHTEWFKKRLGSERFDQLMIRGRALVKIDKEAIREILKERIKLLEEK